MGIHGDGYYTDETMLKVYRTLRKTLDEDKSMDIISALQNEGILFRERPPNKAAGPVYRAGPQDE